MSNFTVKKNDNYVECIEQVLRWVPVSYRTPTNEDSGDYKWGTYMVSYNGNIEKMEYKSGIETLHMILDGYFNYGRIGDVYIGDDTKDGFHEATDSELLDIGRADDVFVLFTDYSHYEDIYYDLTIYFTGRSDYPRNYYWLETGTIEGISDDILKED